MRARQTWCAENQKRNARNIDEASAAYTVEVPMRTFYAAEVVSTQYP